MVDRYLSTKFGVTVSDEIQNDHGGHPRNSDSSAGTLTCWFRSRGHKVIVFPCALLHNSTVQNNKTVIVAYGVIPDYRPCSLEAGPSGKSGARDMGYVCQQRLDGDDGYWAQNYECVQSSWSPAPGLGERDRVPDSG